MATHLSAGGLWKPIALSGPRDPRGVADHLPSLVGDSHLLGLGASKPELDLEPTYAQLTSYWPSDLYKSQSDTIPDCLPQVKKKEYLQTMWPVIGLRNKKYQDPESI